MGKCFIHMQPIANVVSCAGQEKKEEGQVGKCFIHMQPIANVVLCGGQEQKERGRWVSALFTCNQ